jgi:hypothetical protein
VITGTSFILKFIFLTALSDPAGGAFKRALLSLFEGMTLGALSQQPLHPATGYIAFGTLVLFLIGMAMLPAAATHRAQPKLRISGDVSRHRRS